MKAIFFALAIFATTNSLFAQVNFTTAPRQLQLYPRNLLTNKAQVPISGTVTTADNKEIKVEMYRNNVLADTKTQALSGTAGETFSFVDEIVSEMASYKFVISLKDVSNTYSVVGAADNVVAGDAIIIQGQSNAVATMQSGSSSAYNNNYVRVYGFGNESFDANIVHQWYIAQGDGDENSAGNTGQWGLVLGDTIVKTTGRPIAIFNGGRGGQFIAYFQRNDLNKTDSVF
ncbi:MAG: hypothetical protein QM726_03310 [Chitinophagaceae bacterium]